MTRQHHPSPSPNPYAALNRRDWLALSAIGASALVLPPAMAQQAYPSKSIRLVVPFNAGGATDVLARLIGEKLGARLGQPVVIDNKAGASGILGTDTVAKANADGHTLLFSLTTSMLTNQFLYEKLPYNPQRDLALVSQVALGPIVLVVNAKVPVNNAQELLAYVAANKDKLSYGSYGIGSHSHLIQAYISNSQQANMTHIAYKGEAPMIQDLIGGQIPMGIASALGLKPHIDSGKLKAIGVTGPTRMLVLPNVPTLAEQGLKDDVYGVVGWLGLAAPANTPKEIVQRLATEVKAITELPDVNARIVAMGFIPNADTPEAFAASYKRDLPIWERMVKLSGAKLE